MASITPYKTRSGQKRYRVIWRVNGRQVEETCGTYAEARQRKTEVEHDALAGRDIDPAFGRQILNDYFDAWLPDRLVDGRSLRPSTVTGYKRLWNRTIRTSIGRRLLRDIRPTIVRKWHAAVAAEKSQDQAAKAYRLLHAVLATAVADDLIRDNPCRIRGAGREHAEERPLAELAVVFDLADAIGDRYFALVLLVAFSSTRTGEALGLRRGDVDLLHREIHVLVQAQELEGLGRTVLDYTKNEAGRRTISIPQLLVDALDDHLAAYTGPDADDPVFTGPRGAPLRRATLSEAWRRAKRATGAPADLRLYDLRHHAATVAARTPGITLKELMTRIGHASMAAALRYQHAAQERDRQVAAYLDEQIQASDRSTRAPITAIDANRR